MNNATPATSATAIAQAAHLPRLSPGRWLSGWRLAAFLVSLVTLVPLVVVLSSFLYPQSEVWDHLSQHVLPGILLNTFWLALGVALCTGFLGVTLAWLTAVCDFPGRRFFSWALMLPLAMPAYVTAFVAIGLLDFTGPLQTLLREWFGTSDWFPRIRSRGGVILVMSLALYPYVYLLARNAFLTQGRRALEAGQSLGLSRRTGFVRIALPMARPWIVAGIMLVLMETLADFGTVAIFNYDTFTTAIYKAWFGLFSLSTASQLASILVLIVFVVVAVEQRWRGVRRYHGSRSTAATYRLKPATGWAVSLLLGLFFCTVFVIPLLQLLIWSASVFAEEFDARYPMFVWHSVLLSAHRRPAGGGRRPGAVVCAAPVPRLADALFRAPVHAGLCGSRHRAGGRHLHPGGLARQPPAGLAALPRRRRRQRAQGHPDRDDAGVCRALPRARLQRHRQRHAAHHPQPGRSRARHGLLRLAPAGAGARADSCAAACLPPP